MKMKYSFYFRFLREEDGVLTMEWILLLTLFVIGIVSGLSAIRDATNLQFFQTAQAVGNANPSYTIAAYESRNTGEGSSSNPVFKAQKSSYVLNTAVEVTVKDSPSDAGVSMVSTPDPGWALEDDN